MCPRLCPFVVLGARVCSFVVVRARLCGLGVGWCSSPYAMSGRNLAFFGLTFLCVSGCFLKKKKLESRLAVLCWNHKIGRSSLSTQTSR